MWSKKSFKSQAAETAGEGSVDRLPGIGAAGLRSGAFVSLGVSLCRTSPRRPGGETTDQGDRRDAGAVRFPADPDPTAARRLARQSQADLPHLPGRRPELEKQTAQAK